MKALSALEAEQLPISEGTGGRTITNLRFADDIDGLAREEEELAKLDERLDKASTAYIMEKLQNCVDYGDKIQVGVSLTSRLTNSSN